MAEPLGNSLPKFQLMYEPIPPKQKIKNQIKPIKVYGFNLRVGIHDFLTHARTFIHIAIIKTTE